MKKFFFATLTLLLMLGSNTTYGQFDKLLKSADKAKGKILGKKDSGNIGAGLQEALEVGTTAAVDQLSADGGYLSSVYKVGVPVEAQRIIKTVKKLPGFDNVEEKLVQQMNAAAELAAKEATPIFVEAIRGITFRDAMQILQGKDNAATSYLDRQTRASLTDAFAPIIKEKLDEVNATTYWSSVLTAYNKVPLVKKMNPDLAGHVNGKALDGLFGLIAKKESGIRADVDQRTSPLLKEVFAQQD